MKKTAKMTVIQGPIAPSVTGGVIYEVTLASGMLITNPVAFGLIADLSVSPTTIVTEKGQVLVGARERQLEDYEPGAERERVHGASRRVATTRTRSSF